jgi:Domain of unknown function (DUF929)
VTRSTASQRRSQHERLRELKRQAQARRTRSRYAAAAVGGVLLLLLAMVVVKLAMPRPEPAAVTVPSTVVDALLRVPASTLDAAGRGQASAPTRISGRPALTDAGKPLVLYVGAEYCPFCAAQRWGLIVALGRFGTFTGLSAAHSATDDVYPGTPTLSFHGATYTSPYLAFQGVEVASSVRRGNSYAPLDTLSAAQQAVLAEYDAPPYVPAGSAGAVPFVDFGNRFVMSGAAFSPALLSGLSHEQIVGTLAAPDSPVAAAMLGSANAFTAVLCELTGGEPAQVCAGPAARAYSEFGHAG